MTNRHYTEERRQDALDAFNAEVRIARNNGWSEEDAPVFVQYRRDVNHELIIISGVGCDDLADFDYSAAFQDGREPREVALEILEENGFPMDLIEDSEV